MKKKKMIISMLVFPVADFSVTAEISVKDQASPPPLLENNNGSYAVDVLGSAAPGYGNTVPTDYHASREMAFYGS